jgi:hypothetical protein
MGNVALASTGTRKHDATVNARCKTCWGAVTLVVLGACAGELDDPSRFAFLAKPEPGPPPACVTELFASRCDSSVCHGDGAKLVNLLAPDVQDRLVDQPSSDQGECRDRTLVSSTGGASLLLEKLTMPTCGVKMPLVGNTTPEEVACVRAWVESVAGTDEDGGS